ncbi:Translation elongation factor P Lys34:lysine transferase [Methylophaga frappieri]|uniref:Translation elongation factor P Lys34:lysine transferase n=1 Tax=Methylophaga frappieri (strain ATCC BAA-2434 / DSM 25690 / JAM7) TaxID=754477 RepID=I1YHC1_METFJ|nr:EF-P lysine aminoacylase EpmA [Methylophaga frappieri]AFJ02314.1 Translation elongation factor P Lys34:lysine transferase [Methylophaga frappieri]
MTNLSATATLLKRRSELYHSVRRFFYQRHVLEVQTPVLSFAAPTAPYLDSFSTTRRLGQRQQNLYLQTSPEFAMKRLLAAGSGAIFQICPVFRHGEAGKQHSPEFTMLEWYRPGFTLTDLMDEVDALIQSILACPPAKRLTYAQAFNDVLSVDIFYADSQQLRQLARQHIAGLPTDWQRDKDGWLELLMSEVIEPAFKNASQPVMISDFPASQAQLATCHANAEGHPVAARFELYLGGLELANGYHELADADELARRFKADNVQRKQLGLPEMPIDTHLLAALEADFPDCSGVALGLDRLLMLLMDVDNIDAVQAIPFETA